MKKVILAIVLLLVFGGVALAASLSPPTVSQNGNIFTVRMNPLDGSVRNWIYAHKAFLADGDGQVVICVFSEEGGEWVQFRAVSVLTDDNSEWEQSKYTNWYEVPQGRCGENSPPPPVPRTTVGPGTYIVGTEIQPGTYLGVASSDATCYWERLSSLSEELDAIIANDHVRDGQFYVDISPSDYAFTIKRCTVTRQ